MLTISKPHSASQAQTYHSKEFTSPDQSYWSRGETVTGEWQGQLAEKFGLTGAVGADEFARLSEGSTRQLATSSCVTASPINIKPPMAKP